MKISEPKSLAICLYFLLILCLPFVVLSYHSLAKTPSAHKSLKFYMKPWHRNVTKSQPGSDHLRVDAFPDRNSISMLVNISFGSPPLPQFLVMDTGSGITWIQCSSCAKCFNQTAPSYTPYNLTTFQFLDCGSSFCQTPQICDEVHDVCIYQVRYQDLTKSQGYLATEKLTFITPDHQTVTEEGVVFGCGLFNFANPHQDIGSGILGLSAGPLSLISQRGRRFSYCIGNLNNHSYPYNILIIGDGTIFEGATTPLEVYKQSYYLTMKGIAVGNIKLALDPKMFLRSPSGDGGMIIDSGTMYTYLPRPAYESLKTIVKSVFVDKPIEREDELCYFGQLSKMSRFPPVSLLFARGARIDLKPESVFFQRNSFTTCLAMRPVDKGGHGFIGILAQQYYNVGYDPDGNTLSLNNVDCERLDKSL